MNCDQAEAKKLFSFRIPYTKEPYVNTHLYSAGVDPESGAARYFISSWNSNIGSTGLLVDENDNVKEFRFHRDSSSSLAQCGFYSACYAGENIIWLVGDLAQVYRLDLVSGELKGFLTGAPSALVFAGMVYDEKTKKLFFSAYCPPKEVSVSFDTVKCASAAIYSGKFEATTSRGSFSNGDGTYSIDYTLAGLGSTSLCIWDPAAETFEVALKCSGNFNYCSDAKDDAGRILNSELGWYSPISHSFEKVNMPPVNAYWFDRRGDLIYGSAVNSNNIAEVYSYSFKDLTVKKLFEVTDGLSPNIRLTPSGKFISVGFYGDYSVYDLNGTLIKSSSPHGMSIGAIDCLYRLSCGKIVGTPFITQRFWTYDPDTQNGADAGRAAPGGGEVLQINELNGKLYMASYTEGRLTEYDPNCCADDRYPVNPRLVAEPAHSMRPVCHTTGFGKFYWASNHHYGIVGCELSCYDTASSSLVTNDNPIDGQHFYSLFCNEGCRRLIGASRYHTDCGIARPTSDKAFIALFDADNLKLIQSYMLPDGYTVPVILGNVTDNEYLILRNNTHGFSDAVIASVSSGEIGFSEPLSEHHIRGAVKYAGKPGFFVSLYGGNVTLQKYDSGMKNVSLIAQDPGYKGIFVSPGCVMCVKADSVDVFELKL